jgi:branched-chain amino acid aminotransferase
MTPYTTDQVWMNGALIPWNDATVHLLTPTLHYGWGIFEGIRCYSSEAGPALFRPIEHLKRFERSAKLYHLNLGYTLDELIEAIITVVIANKLTNCYIRPIAYLGAGNVGLNHLDSEVHVAIAAWQWENYLGVDATIKGCRVCTSSWRHIGQNDIPPTAKGTGQYVNSSLAKMAAVKAGYDEALLLNAAGNVVQATAENIFVLDGNTLITPPTSEGLLPGITRDTIKILAAQSGLTLVERPLVRTDVYFADEVFLTGTAAEVVPVIEADDRRIGTGKPGPVTTTLIEGFKAATTGRLLDKVEWTFRVV